MDTILTRNERLAATVQPAGRGSRLLRRLATLASAAAERLTSPYRDVPPEFFRFPPF